MKICFLGAASSIHIVRWVNAMAGRGHHVHLITMHKPGHDMIDQRVTVHHLTFRAPFGYYINLFKVRKLLQNIQPKVLHVHYASGYGTLARLVNFKPTLLSVWGSDVFLFPYKNNRAKKTLQKNLQAMNQITATSYALKSQTELFVNHKSEIKVVPFGIDLSVFKPLKQNKQMLTIGTVKGLEHVYGIDILLRAVARLLKKLQQLDDQSYAEKLQIQIVGDGSELGNLKQLANELNIDQMTKFVGKVPNNEVPAYLNDFDIYCALSRSESFGVAILEASACEVPVVVSEVGGLPEVVQNEQTGFIVNHNDEDEIVNRLLQLIINSDLRKQYGKSGRKFVQQYYNWNENITEMENIYSTIK